MGKIGGEERLHFSSIPVVYVSSHVTALRLPLITIIRIPSPVLSLWADK